MSVDAEDIVWATTPEDVAAILRARTKDANMTETGMWDANTRPTLTQVQEIIDIAVGEMTSAIGVTVPDACLRGARSTCTLLAAMLIELSYWPEQVRSDRSAYQQYKELYDKQLALLQECVQSGGGGAEGGGVGGLFHNVPAVPVTTWRYGFAGWPFVDSAFWSMVGPWGDIGGDHWPEPENPENWRNPFQPPRQPPLAEDLPVGDLPASGKKT